MPDLFSQADVLKQAITDVVNEDGPPSVATIRIVAADMGATERVYTEYGDAFSEFCFPDGSSIIYGMAPATMWN